MNFYASHKSVDDVDFDDRTSFSEKTSIYCGTGNEICDGMLWAHSFQFTSHFIDTRHSQKCPWAMGNFVESSQRDTRRKTRRRMNFVSEHDWSKTISNEWLAACQHSRWQWPFLGAARHVYESKKTKQKTKYRKIYEDRCVGAITTSAINKTKNIFKFILKSWTGHECIQSPFRMCCVGRYAAIRIEYVWVNTQKHRDTFICRTCSRFHSK